MKKHIIPILVCLVIIMTGCAHTSKQTLSFGTSTINITTDKDYVYNTEKEILSNNTASINISFISGDTMSKYISTLISYAAKKYFIDASKGIDRHGNTRIYYICSHDGVTYYEGIMWIENSDVGVFMQADSAEKMSFFEHIQFSCASSTNPITAAEKLNSLYAYIMGDVGTKTSSEGSIVEEAITAGEESAASKASTNLIEPVDDTLIHESDLEAIASEYSLSLISDTSTNELTRLVKYQSDDEKTTVNFLVPMDKKTVSAMYKALIEGMGISSEDNPVAQRTESGNETTYNFAFHDGTSIITVRSQDKNICDGIMKGFGYRYDVITSDVSLDEDNIILPSDTTTATLSGTDEVGEYLGDPIYQAGNIQTKISDTDKDKLEKALTFLENAIQKEEKYSDNCTGFFVMDSDSIAYGEVNADDTMTFPALVFMEEQKCYAQINITVANMSNEAVKAINCYVKSYSLY